DLEWNLGISENEILHVLIVDDNKINQMITKKVLEKKKIQCTIIDNGKDAVEAVKNNNFDLILMDVHMPEMSGIEATQLIRKFNQKIPIIALTAVSIEDNLDEFLEIGFNDVIPKPFQTDVFFEKIYNSI
ncbi:MAG TPA: response regulator, partial [Flavobacteriaceae bacterium]|nr:response regulator [Flavobacteriaceae bacterium]